MSAEMIHAAFSETSEDAFIEGSAIGTGGGLNTPPVENCGHNAFAAEYSVPVDHCEVTRVDMAYLQPMELVPGTDFVRSPMGTGKTTRLGELIAKALNEGQSVLVLVARRSLARNAASGLALPCYLDTDKGVSLDTAKDLVLCVDSAHKVKTETSDGVRPRDFDLVIIEESEQTLAHLTRTTNAPRANTDHIKYWIRTAKQVVCLDATMSRVTVDPVRNMRPQDTPRLLINEYLVENEVVIWDSKNALLGHTDAVVGEGGSLYLATDSKRQAEDIAEQLRMKYPDRNGLLITADTVGDEAQSKFLAHPNAQASAYDWIVASPAISTGLSIDEREFDLVAGIFEGIVPAEEALQAVSRVRSAQRFDVFLRHGTTKYRTLPEERQKCAGDWAYAHGIYDTHDGTASPDIWFAALHVAAQRHHEFGTAHLRKTFCLLCGEMGYAIANHQATTIEKGIGKQVTRAARNSGDEARTKRLLDAPCLSDDQAKAIEARKDKRTTKEQAALEAYRLRCFYVQPPSEPLSEELIKMDDCGRLRAGIERLETLRTPLTKLRDRDKAEGQANDRHPHQYRSREIEAALSLDLLAYLQFDPHTMKTSGYRWDKEELKTSGLVEYVIGRATDIESILAIKVPANIGIYSTRFVSDFLRSFGMKVRSQQIRSGSARLRVYWIDEFQLYRVRTIIAVRMILKDPRNDGQWFVSPVKGLYRCRPFQPAPPAKDKSVTAGVVVDINKESGVTL